MEEGLFSVLRISLEEFHILRDVAWLKREDEEVCGEDSEILVEAEKESLETLISQFLLLIDL